MDSQRPPMLQRIHCINCNICVNTCNAFRPQPVLHLDRRVASLICHWVSPVIVTEEDCICEACFNRAMRCVNEHISEGNDPYAGPSHRGHTQVCPVCGRSIANRQSHLIRSGTDNLAVEQIIENRIAPRQISQSDRCCHACWMSARREATRQQEIDERRPLPGNLSNVPAPPDSVNQSDEESSLTEREGQTRSPETLDDQQPDGPSNIMLPNFRRAPNTASHCLFAGCTNVTGLHTISEELRKTVFHTYRYYVPVLARVCTEHLTANIWDSLFDAPNSITMFTAQQVEHIFLSMKPSKAFLDFSSIESVQQIDNYLFMYWMGLTKENFLSLLHDLPRVLETHRGILGLAGILMKMRTGDSDERLATILVVPRTTLERLMDKARKIMLQDFIPRNLGINHKTREELIQNNLSVPNGIHNQNNSNLIIICDGSYIFLNKSSNFLFQKETYSLHKYRNLLKPFLLVCCNGYIIDCFGPYKATKSDADIMSSLFRDENSSLRQYFQANDIFILDRGFRDCVSLLENCNYKVCMPESLQEGEHQLTTTQANRSRCVTICRWVVEVVNGYFKRDYRLFRFDHFNKTVPHMFDYYKIAAALINKFGVRLRDRVDADQILNVIRERMSLENNLSRVVNELNLNRRTSLFISMTANADLNFPLLEYNDLILFALGTYQIRLARSYYGEHIRSQGEYIIEISRESINVAEYNLREVVKIRW